MTWAALTNTELLDASLWCGNPGAPAPPDCLPTSFAGGGNNLRLATIDAWVSGALDTSRDKFVIPRGGGHADWPGNQVLGFKPGVGWTLLRNASPVGTFTPATPTSGTFTPFYSDGTPASVHSYGAVAYLPNEDRIWSAGGIYWSPGGSSSPHITWWWNPNDASWTQKYTRPGGYGTSAVWDPNDAGRLLVRTSDALWTYDPDLDTGPSASPSPYTKLFNQDSNLVDGSAIAMDATERRYYYIPYRSASATPGIRMCDLNNLTLKDQVLLTEGDVQIETMRSCGLLFVDGRLVGLGPSATAGKFAVYTAIVEGRGLPGQPKIEWVRDAADVNEPASTGTHGIWNKFFGPIAGKFYVINQPDQDVYEYTPSWTSTDVTIDVVSDLLVEGR